MAVTERAKYLLLQHLAKAEEICGGLKQEPNYPNEPDCCPILQFIPERFINNLYCGGNFVIDGISYNCFPESRTFWWETLSYGEQEEIYDWLCEIMQGSKK